MDKPTLRKQIRAAKKEIPLEIKIERSRPILNQVEQHPVFQKANTLLLYWSMDDEVQTHEFVEKWYREKTILLPCVNGDDLLLRPYQGPTCMKSGEQFGIGEPTGEIFTELDLIDLIIVPGVAFDRKNNRMGRGRGFYDRLLKSTPNAYKIGIAFDFQILETIPTEDFDIPMDCVIGETSSK